MKKVHKYSRWSEENRRELALIIKKGLDKKSNIYNACLYAAKKLGRTPDACQFQWHHWIKDNLDRYLTPLAEKTDLELLKKEVVEQSLEFRDQLKDVGELPKTWPEARVELTQRAHSVDEKKLPTIEVHSSMNSEVCEIIEHVGGTIIARASRGIIIVIKE
jgi:hypothetical protein